MHIKQDVIWKRTDSGSMLYNTRSEERMLLNSLASNIFLSRYVNHFTADEIAESIRYTFRDTDPNLILSDVAELIECLEMSPFLTGDPDDFGVINLIECQEQINSLVIEVTGRCNLNCTHCLESGSRQHGGLDLAAYDRLAEELGELKVLRVVLTGGEPFLRRDVVAVIRAFADRNIRTVVFTNGLLVTEDHLRQLDGANVLLRFSIDGAQAETHDAIRGAGTFERVLQAINRTRRHGIDTGVSFTLTRDSFEQFWPMLQLADSLGVVESEISDVRPVGSAKENALPLLTHDQRVRLRVLNLEAANRYVHFRKGMGLANLQRSLAETDYQKKHPCNAGVSMAYIDASGQVYPCMLFREVPTYRAGSLAESSFADLWTGSPVFAALRAVELDRFEQCAGCLSKAICVGGCRALAVRDTGDLYGVVDESFCAVSRDVVDQLAAGELNQLLGAN